MAGCYQLIGGIRWPCPHVILQQNPPGLDLYVTRRGVPLSGASWLKPTPERPDLANTNYIVGRYAYQIYDVGGMLDINTAGLTLDICHQRASQGGVQWADLTALGLSTDQVEELMKSRFSATMSYSDLPERIRYEAEPRRLSFSTFRWRQFRQRFSTAVRI